MISAVEPIITPQIANHALHYFNSDAGFSGGAYSDALFRLAATADDDHLVKLASIHPTEIAAFRLGRDHIGGLEMLRTIAAIQ